MTLQPQRVAECDCGSDWSGGETYHDWYEQVPLRVSPWLPGQLLLGMALPPSVALTALGSDCGPMTDCLLSRCLWAGCTQSLPIPETSGLLGVAQPGDRQPDGGRGGHGAARGEWAWALLLGDANVDKRGHVLT